MEEAATQRAPIGKLVAHHLVGNHPPDEDARQEAHHGKEYLTRDEVEAVEQRTAEERQPVDGTKRQRAESTDDGSRDGDDDGSLAAGDEQLFLEEGRRHLVERHQRRQGCQRQQHEEQQRHDVAHNGHGGKSLLEDVGQRDEDERRTAVGTDAYGEGCRENHEAGQDSHQTVDDGYLRGRLGQVGMFREIAGVGTQTAHGYGQRIERLAQRTEEHVAVDLCEVGLKQELNALVGSGQHARRPHDDEQQHEERRHEHLRRPFYAVAHAVFYDEVGDA